MCLCIYVYRYVWMYIFLGSSDYNKSACNVGDPGSIPGLERSLEKGMATHSNILDWQATGHGVIKSWTWLSDYHFDFSYMCVCVCVCVPSQMVFCGIGVNSTIWSKNCPIWKYAWEVQLVFFLLKLYGDVGYHIKGSTDSTQVEMRSSFWRCLSKIFLTIFL